MTAALQLIPGDANPYAAASGAELLDAVEHFVSRFNVFPSEHCAPMLALWYAHTHAAAQLYITPRLILSSAEPGSGKTRVLEVAQFLVAKPKMTMNITPAAIFRLLLDGPITLLFDEVDAVFNNKGGNNEDLRALLNAGYKRSATVSRCVGDARSMSVADFPVYAPVALAGIAGGMPDTIVSRAITVHMQRRRPDEEVEEFWEQRVEVEAAPLRAALADWVGSVVEEVANGTPTMPEGVRDRPAEIWRPLLAVAAAAGAQWPAKAAAACKHFTNTGTGLETGSVGIRLLSDMHDVFTAARAERMATADLVTALRDLEESSWDDLDGKPLDGRRIAAELRRYGIRPRDVKLPGGRVLKGYAATGQGGLADVWARYLTTSATSATSATAQVRPVAHATQVALPVAVGSATGNSSATRLTCAVAEVAEVAPATGGAK